MITESLRHCFGIGPVRLKKLHDAGIRTWSDVVASADQLPAALRESLLEEVDRCQHAHRENDIDYFVRTLHPKDKWRILSEYLDDVSFFDIETDGLDYDARITVIACWHRGSLHSFVEHENLDHFLDLLDEVKLLVSFNGSSFDVPRVLDAFHIPELPCPHLDLRWLCYHHGYHGGLKDIACRAGIDRPQDLNDADGELAIRLWARWEHFEDREALEVLLRYCGSDVVLTLMLAHELSGCEPIDANNIWSCLPGDSRSQPADAKPVAGDFGVGSPHVLRAYRRNVDQ